MTPADVIDVLSLCAAYDLRTVGEVDVMAWHDVIGYLTRDDCLEAVKLHYREQSSRAMPADIRKLALAIRDQREAQQRQTERRLAIEAVPITSDRSAEVAALVHALADSLPKPDAHAKALARVRKERGRPAAVAPAKPKRRNKPPKDYAPPATTDVALLATQYLRDGHAPADVAERLAVSRRWCERTAAQFNDPEAS